MVKRILTMGLAVLALALVAPAIGINLVSGSGVAQAQTEPADPADPADPEDPAEPAGPGGPGRPGGPRRPGRGARGPG